MPKIKSAIKRVEVSERNRTRNRSWKSNIRTASNEVVSAVKDANQANTAEALKQAFSVIDRAVSKGIVHRNTAARKKSRLSKLQTKLAASK